MSRFEPEQISSLSRLAEAMLPAFGELPGAAHIGLFERFEALASTRGDLVPLILRGLRTIDARDAASAWSRLADTDPESHAALREFILGGYFASAQVMAAFGYPADAGTPVDPDEPIDFIRDALLAPVLARGPVWRNS
jgi:hypothetical protein